MTRFTRFFGRTATLLAVSTALLLGTAGCATSSRVGVTSDFDHSVNFQAFKTWSWYPTQTGDTEGGPAQGYQSFLDKRIRTAIEREMNAKGLSYTEKGGDLYVAYSAKVEDKQQANYGGFGPYGYPYGYRYGGLYNSGYITNYKAGTVIIDFVDSRRKELAWRGQGQAQVDKQTISEPEVYRIVNSILGTFPPQDANVRR
ncbi:DUF4136 domain-containing protein [Microvirga sp. STR05]|uniref:DUF4136 domain-containing protein n=1 Tax=Hymenobacter duratus TaxID=2771356 RepID=A0ABR8JDJ3_9BACT|nr:DUF4136 domain-containing protein [Hymenobacter duratus]MBD2714102.1 DUF4136 domain-containing protein [Hymenobacter duratus]MBR7949004.1 DUF4136 domain-containing protein [Microvirga sp. STR05]